MHLPRPIFALIERLVPIACVDALPYRHTPEGIEVGLIRRYTADKKATVWTLVGGRVRYGERLSEALARHLRDALGLNAAWSEVDVDHPTRVEEYFPKPLSGEGHDPRKHAVALAYLVRLDGSVEPGGEALDFRWFQLEEFLGTVEIGFGQRGVIESLSRTLARLSLGETER